jgi:hypothetical protein
MHKKMKKQQKMSWDRSQRHVGKDHQIVMESG